MAALPRPGAAQPFFLQAAPGQRFCLFHPPAGDVCRGALVYVHPFGDEMNKSRRMVAQQARALAAAGFGVLQLDLYGCGDSSGEFSEARWDIWKDDLAAASGWLHQRLGQPVGLWGLRLGALLALDYARSAPRPVERMILWQPVHNGALFLTQFLRLLTANAMLSDSADKERGGTAALRKALLEGEMLEVAGYQLAPELAAAIDSKDGAALAPPGCRVDWFETALPAGRALPPVLERLAGAWRAVGVELQLHQLNCLPFWATQEIEEAPALLAATSALLQETH
jgi:exosortase A-associated hydrolase 2